MNTLESESEDENENENEDEYQSQVQVSYQSESDEHYEGDADSSRNDEDSEWLIMTYHDSYICRNKQNNAVWKIIDLLLVIVKLSGFVIEMSHFRWVIVNESLRERMTHFSIFLISYPFCFMNSSSSLNDFSTKLEDKRRWLHVSSDFHGVLGIFVQDPGTYEQI